MDFCRGMDMRTCANQSKLTSPTFPLAVALNAGEYRANVRLSYSQLAINIAKYCCLKDPFHFNEDMTQPTAEDSIGRDWTAKPGPEDGQREEGGKGKEQGKGMGKGGATGRTFTSSGVSYSPHHVRKPQVPASARHIGSSLFANRFDKMQSPVATLVAATD